MPEISRFRRRLLATILLGLLCVGGGWWLTTPSIDPRLVGEWVNIHPDEFPRDRTFTSDGIEVQTSGAGAVLPLAYCRWSVANDRVTLIADESLRLSATSRVRWQIRQLWDRLRGVDQMTPQVTEYQILEVTPTTLQIQEIGKSRRSEIPVEIYRRKSDETSRSPVAR